MTNLRMMTVAILLWMGAGCGGESKSGPQPVPPPGEPTSLEQIDQDVVTPLPREGVTGGKFVTFRATLAFSPGAASARLMIEVVPFGTPFTGIATGKGDYLPNGYLAQVTIELPDSGDYVWQAWAEDGQGQDSGRVAFAAGSGPAFTVDLSAPLQPRQYLMDRLTELWVGGQSPEVGVVLQANVQSPAGNLVRAQFEVKPLGQPFDGTNVILGSCVQPGAVSEGTALFPAGAYQWRVRTEDYTGATSLWVGFGGNDDAVPAAVDFRMTGVLPSPTADLPASLQQLRTSQFSVIPPGESTSEDKLILTGYLITPLGLPYALEVEVKAVTASFDGTATTVGPYVRNGTVAKVPISPGAGSFHWRARTTNSQAGVSDWVLFGAEGLGVADFTLAPTPNTPPDLPQSLEQFELEGLTGMSAGELLRGNGIIVQAQVSDPDFGNGLLIEVEVKPGGTPFVNVPSAASPIVQCGASTSITLMGMLPGTAYHWQARTVDADGATSAWVEYTGTTASLAPPPTSSGGTGSGGGGTGGGNCSATVSVPLGAGGWMPWAALAALLTLWDRRLRPSVERNPRVRALPRESREGASHGKD